MCRLIESPVSNLAERDDYGNTALYYGVKSGNLEIVQYLTERIGFSPVTGNGDGETPWDIAWAVRRFSYCIAEEKKEEQKSPWIQTGVVNDTRYLSSEGLSKGKRFTGATIGIYVQGRFWGTFTEWEHRRTE